jgi:hypothetical protein
MFGASFALSTAAQSAQTNPDGTTMQWTRTK